MKHFLISVFCIVFSHLLVGQSTFINEINNNAYGSVLRVMSTENQSWAIYSKDSLNLSKFNSCGDIIWNQQYQIPNVTASLSDFTSTQDDGFILLTRAEYNGENCPSLTKINSTGSIVWSYTYAQDDFDYYPYTVTQDVQGNFTVFANLTEVSTNNVFNLVFKVNPFGAVIAAQLYNHGGIWGGAISTSDGGTLFRSGSNLIKLNLDLSVQWVSTIVAGTYNYFAPVEVSNGFIFSGYSNPGQLITYYKIDLLGNLMWGGSKQSNIVGSPKYLKKKSNGNVASVFSQFVLGINYTTVAEFDQEMNLVSQNSFSDESINGQDMCFLTGDIPLIVGSKQENPFYAKLNGDYLSGCDIDLTPITFTATPISLINNSATASPHTLIAISSDFSSNTIPLSTIGICTVPKVLDLGNDTVICDGATLILQNQTLDVFDHYLWSTNEISPSITVSEPGRYWLLVYDECDVNRANDTIWIELLPAINADLGDDRLVCEDVPELLIKPTCSDCQFHWSTGDFSDTILVTEPGKFWLEILNSNGCESTDTVTIDFGKCTCDFYLPNAFSPNDDGLNDMFLPKFECDIVEYTLLIFNRWGEIVFTSTNPLNSWNGSYKGKRVSVDVYNYRLTYTPAFLGNKESPVLTKGIINVVK